MLLQVIKDTNSRILISAATNIAVDRYGSTESGVISQSPLTCDSRGRFTRPSCSSLMSENLCSNVKPSVRPFVQDSSWFVRARI